MLFTDTRYRETPPAIDPSLKLDPERVRTITPGQPRDKDGLEAMVELSRQSDDDPSTFLLPLPPGAPEHDARLFGLWTYEFRFGHKDPVVVGPRPLQPAAPRDQHPAPGSGVPRQREQLDLYVPPTAAGAVPMPTAGGVKTVVATHWAIVATARYAQPVHADASPIGDGVPRTTIGFLLYAQAMRADGSGFRNVLIAHRGATPVGQIAGTHITGYEYGEAGFTQDDIRTSYAAGLRPTRR